MYCVLQVFKMAKITRLVRRKKTKTTKSNGQPIKQRRHYGMDLRREVWWMHNKDNLSLKQIKANIKKEYNETIPDGTICGFYKTRYDEFFSKTAEDRAKVKDARLNPQQRPEARFLNFS